LSGLGYVKYAMTFALREWRHDLRSIVLPPLIAINMHNMASGSKDSAEHGMFVAPANKYKEWSSGR
jgi:hypothetical protein